MGKTCTKFWGINYWGIGSWWNVNDYYIPISNNLFQILQGKGNTPGLISKQQYNIREGPEVFYNKSGAINSTFAGDDEDIYIECQPTGEEGEVLFKKDISSGTGTGMVTGMGLTDKMGNIKKAPSFEDIMANPATQIIIGLLASFVVFKIGETIWKKVKSDD